MAPHQAKRNIQKAGRQPSVPKDRGKPFVPVTAYFDLSLIGKRPQGIKKKRPQLSSRKSARLEEIQTPQERTVSKDRNMEPKHPLPSPTSNTPGKEACHYFSAML